MLLSLLYDYDSCQSAVEAWVLKVNHSLNLTFTWQTGYNFSDIDLMECDVDSHLYSEIDSKEAFSASSYGCSTPSNISEYLNVERLNKEFLPIDESIQLNVDNVPEYVDLELEAVSSKSSASASIDESADVHAAFDVMSLRDVDDFRSDYRFGRICRAKFSHFTRFTVRPYVFSIESERITITELRDFIFAKPHVIEGSSALKFWVVAWWRCLYSQLYSLSELMRFGGIGANERDMLRIGSTVGPHDSSYMHPQRFVEVNDLQDVINWNKFQGMGDLLSRRLSTTLSKF